MGHFLHCFPEKFIEMPKHGSLFEKLQVLAKSMIFRAFSRKFIQTPEIGSLLEKLRIAILWHVYQFFSWLLEDNKRENDSSKRVRKDHNVFLRSAGCFANRLNHSSFIIRSGRN